MVYRYPYSWYFRYPIANFTDFKKGSMFNDTTIPHNSFHVQIGQSHFYNDGIKLNLNKRHIDHHGHSPDSLNEIKMKKMCIFLFFS